MQKYRPAYLRYTILKFRNCGWGLYLNGLPYRCLKLYNLYEIGVLGIPHSDHCMHLLNKFLFLVVIEVHVPFRQASFASAVLYQYKAYLGKQIILLSFQQGVRCKPTIFLLFNWAAFGLFTILSF